MAKNKCVGVELYCVYLLSEAQSLLLNRAAHHLDKEGKALRHERKLWYGRLRTEMGRLLQICTKMNDEIYEMQPNMAKSYDHHLKLANAFARLVLLAYDRGRGTSAAVDALVDGLKEQLQGQEMVADDELDWFKLK